MDFLFYLYATVTITFELVMNIEQSIQAQEHILIKSELYTLLTLAIGEKLWTINYNHKLKVFIV